MSVACFIADQRAKQLEPQAATCRVLDVSPAWCYTWLGRGEDPGGCAATLIGTAPSWMWRSPRRSLTPRGCMVFRDWSTTPSPSRYAGSRWCFPSSAATGHGRAGRDTSKLAAAVIDPYIRRLLGAAGERPDVKMVCAAITHGGHLYAHAFARR